MIEFIIHIIEQNFHSFKKSEASGSFAENQKV